jgi:hypothetical protein
VKSTAFKSPAVPRLARWRSGTVGAGLVLASGCATPTLNQRVWSADAGAFLSYDFGGPRAGHFGLGLETRLIYAQQQFECSQGSVGYGGFAGRVALFGWDQVRVSVAPQLGLTTPGPFVPSLGGELGGGYRFGREAGLFLQPGVEASVASALFVRVEHLLGRDNVDGAFAHSGSVDLGGRLGPRAGQGCYVVGRPLRRDEGRAPLPIAVSGVVAPRSVHGAPADMSLDDDDRREAASVWAERACTEWASVPAFWELAQQLEGCGAPPALAQHARAAAEDEMRHALHATALAATLARAELALEPPVMSHRVSASGASALVRLAVESWLDGCVGEGTASACAVAEAELAAAVDLRAGHRIIAADEARHAELGWEILAWALSAADTETRAIIARATGGPERPAGPPHRGRTLEAYGCLTESAQSRVRHRALAESSSRRAALLARQT